MAYEDFTTYTDVDEDSDFTITANKITIDTLRRDALSYIRSDKGIDHFTDFTHYLKVNWIGADLKATCGFWNLSNSSNSIFQMETNNEGINARLFFKLTGTLHQWSIFDMTDGDNDRYNGALGTLYLEISRSGTTFTMRLYSDEARTLLQDTVTVETDLTAYRYLFGAISGEYATDIDRAISCEIENLDINEAPTPTATDKNIPNYFNSQFITHH